MDIFPMTLIDGYKLDHRQQYPIRTSKIYANFTPRKSRVKGVEKVVAFGYQYFVKEYLIDLWQRSFFDQPKEKILKRFKRRIDNYAGPNNIGVSHIEKLHDLGYLPLRIKAIPEGSLVNMRVPVLTITNTIDDFFWLPNHFETLLSCIIWKPMTSATTAFLYKKTFLEYAKRTGYDPAFCDW